MVSELRLTAGCVLMELARPAVSETSVYANGLNQIKNIIQKVSYMFSHTPSQSL